MATIKTLEDIEMRLGEIHATEAPGEGNKLDPATIALLLEMFVSLVSGCLAKRKPKDIASFAVNSPIRTRIALAAGMREAGIPPRDRPLAMRVAMKAASEATPAAISALGGPLAPLDDETVE